MATRKRGFTLIELLTVFAVVAVLTALVLPAVSAAQDEARQRTCMNNVKQIALAMHNYHDVHKVLPPAWISAKPDASLGTFFGWQAMLLPYLDQAPLYNQLDFKVIDENPLDLLQTKVTTLRCPSDPMVDHNPLRGKLGTSSYSGNSGDERLPGSVDPLPKTSGIMWRNSAVRFSDITDGMSNTFMAGERCLDSGAAIWMGVTKNRNENDAVTDCNHENQLNAGMGSFSSRHPGGVFFVMCDGAARYTPDSIDSAPELGTFQKLANRSDGQSIGDF